MIKLLVSSSEPCAVEGLRSAIQTNSTNIELFSCTPQPASAELARAVELHRPDVVLFDGGQEPLAVLAEVDARAVKIVLWVAQIGVEMAVQAMSRGVRGLLRKTLAVAHHVECIERVGGGNTWFEKQITEEYFCGHHERRPLTNREADLIMALSEGLKNKEIAMRFNISEGTVKVYLSNLFRKMGCKDRFELALWAVKNLGPNYQGKRPDSLIKPIARAS